MANHLIIDESLLLKQNEKIGNKLEDFEILNTLGKGGFGLVSKVKSKKNHKLYAMKMINFDLIKEPREKDLALNEIKIIQNLNSPHIIKYYNSFQEGNRLYIIMEFMNNGDIKGYINAHQNMNKPIPENELWELFYQCIAGLFYIHKENLIHRDIKPANLFMTDDKAIKIGDFGISGTAKKSETLMIGTPNFMSPEMFTNTGYSNKVDVYALGISFFEMCFYDTPRKIVEIKTPQGVRGEIQDIPAKNNINVYSKEMVDLINWMIQRDPNQRPTAQEVLNYVRKIYNSKVQQNSSIDCVYRSLFSFRNLTNFMKGKSQIINSSLDKPISNSFLYAIGSMDNYQNWPLQLATLREILTYENPGFPDPGKIDPIDLVRFILERFHKESILNKNTINGDNPYISTPDNNPSICNYQSTLQNYFVAFKNCISCVSDLFFGTYEIIKYCNNCKNKKFYFQNFFYITFNIEEALKNGITGNNSNLMNYFLKQNYLMINSQSFCCFCNNMTFHQETKKFFNLPYNLIICFKGEKQKYDNLYINYQLNLNLAQLGLKSSPINYTLKAVINRNVVNENKFYTGIYFDNVKQKWIMSDGYAIQFVENPLVMNNSNFGDVIMLFYSSLN